MSKKHDEAMVIEYDRNGDASELRERRKPLPAPGPGEVVVEVIATGISHIDGFIRSGREADWPETAFPRGSGSDFAGIVVGAGPQTTGFTVGTQVIGHVRSGAHATFIVVPVTALVTKPKNVSWEVAGGLYLAGATALDTLDGLRLGADDVVVISAAAGAVGSIEAQLAKLTGATVIGTCGDRNFDYLRQLGIAPVKYGDGISNRIRTAARKPVTCFIDNFGQDGRALAQELGVPDSRYRSSLDRRDTELRLLDDDPDAVAHGTHQLERLAQLAADHAFTLLISGFYPLSSIVEAYGDLQLLHSRGKIVLGTHPVTTYRTVTARSVQEAGD